MGRGAYAGARLPQADPDAHLSRSWALVTDLDVVNWATNDEDGKRLDLSVVMGDKLFLVDVARVNSAAPFYATSDGLAAVSKAAKAKIVHHQAALQKWNATHLFLLW